MKVYQNITFLLITLLGMYKERFDFSKTLIRSKITFET